MAWQIIPQPNGKFSIFSTITDTFIYRKLTRKQVRKVFIKEAKEIAVQNANKDLNRILGDIASKGIGNTMWNSYEEALQLHKSNSKANRDL